LLAGLLRDMGEDRRVERLEDGRGALGVRGGKRATPVGDGEQDEIGEFPLRDVELELVEGRSVYHLADILLQPVLFDDTEGWVGKLPPDLLRRRMRHGS